MKGQDVKYFSPTELERFFSVIDDRRKLDIFQTIYELGCRVGELCDLRLKWFNEDYIKVWAEKSDDFRYCVISDELYEELTEWYFDNRKIKKRGPSMFIYETARTIRNWMYKYGKKANLPDDKVKPHTLRHTFVMTAINRGWNPQAISEQTGHSIKTLFNIYGRPSIEDRNKELKEKPINGAIER